MILKNVHIERFSICFLSQDHVQLQAARDRYQLVSEAVLPVINIFYLQLQLLQKIHQGQKVVATAIEAAGSQTELENLLTDLNVCKQ